MGPNGSGKSTLANILSGKPGYDISGDLKYEGQDLNQISIEEQSSKRHVLSLFNILQKYQVLILTTF